MKQMTKQKIRDLKPESNWMIEKVRKDLLSYVDSYYSYQWKIPREIMNRKVSYILLIGLVGVVCLSYLMNSPNYTELCQDIGYDGTYWGIGIVSSMEKDGKCYFTCQRNKGGEDFIFEDDKIFRNKNIETEVFKIPKGDYNYC